MAIPRGLQRSNRRIAPNCQWPCHGPRLGTLRFCGSPSWARAGPPSPAQILHDPAFRVTHAVLEGLPITLDELEHPVVRIAAFLADGSIVPALVHALPTEVPSALPAQQQPRWEAAEE